jgi:hypothetical protein
MQPDDSTTIRQYDAVRTACREVFVLKMKDYGTAWRILRTSSLTDQIFIKAQRIRSLETKKTTRVGEGIRPEFIGIVNYSIMALIQLELGADTELELEHGRGAALYDRHSKAVRELMLRKNHDYGEAWRGMRISSLTDIILMKLMRIKQIEDHDGKTLLSEGVDANYTDIINYALFALIKLDYEDH